MTAETYLPTAEAGSLAYEPLTTGQRAGLSLRGLVFTRAARFLICNLEAAGSLLNGSDLDRDPAASCVLLLVPTLPILKSFEMWCWRRT